jgi:uncharacterized protein
MDTPTQSPHGPLRRKDREITDRAEIDAILQTGQVMHLALADGNIPFVVPVFYAYDGTALYFHSARSGSKMEILKKNNLVCFEVSLDLAVIPGEKPCDFEAKHRTVIGLGKASLVEEENEKRDALNRIVARFTDKKFDYPAPSFNATAVVRIAIESVKGKKHGF